MIPALSPRTTPGAAVEPLAPGAWRLRIPAGSERPYRWAQLDDYLALPRRAFRWSPSVTLALRARVSAAELPGTWGFGWWNDPFSLGLGLGGASRRLPAPPQAAWFFYASPPNYLALRDTHPAQGFLAATFESARVPAPLLALALPALPLLGWPLAARRLRRVARRFVREAAARLPVDVTVWHTYTLEWCVEGVRFLVDGEPAFATVVAPRGPLGLVLWIDNQYAAFPPSGRVRFGTLANPAAGLELAGVEVCASADCSGKR